MNVSSVNDCALVELGYHRHECGCITMVENEENVPFSTRRVYCLYDVPAGESRGGHAHRDLHQLLVAASGSFSVTLDDGCRKRCFLLNRPNQGLLIVPGIWRTLEDFSPGSVCLVLASHEYDEADYIRDYGQFQEYKKAQGSESLAEHD